MNRDGLTQEEARQRIATQLPLAAKVANADYVVRTDGSMDETDRQVDAVMRQLTNHQPPTTNH